MTATAPAVQRRVVITGVGVASSLGCDVESFWTAIQRGHSGITRVARLERASFPVSIAGEVQAGPPENGDGDAADADHRALVLGRWATELAWRAAGLEVVQQGRLDRERVGVCLGVGGFPIIEQIVSEGGRPQQAPQGDESHAVEGRSLELVFRRAFERRPGLLSQFRLGDVSADLGDLVGAGGPRLSVQCACASGALAVAEAAGRVRGGSQDVMVSGGTDSMLSMFSLLGFEALGVLSRNPEPHKASRPFDARRDGFVLGEGAGILVLEELEHARRRQAPILAEVAGYGSANDAYRFTDLHPQGLGATACMRAALASAGLEPEDIDYINAHGTSTAQNDVIETAAIKEVFGDHARRLAVSSSKSQIGHLLCAAGGIELVITALALRDGIVPPTINLEQPDPSCDLDYVPGRARRRRLRAALSSSFGFGGQCGAVILRRWDG